MSSFHIQNLGVLKNHNSQRGMAETSAAYVYEMWNVYYYVRNKKLGLKPFNNTIPRVDLYLLQTYIL